MKNKLIFLSIALILSSVKISQAADVVYNSPEAPASEEASIWGGAYIGGQVGYYWARAQLSFNNEDARKNINGFIGGVYAGYNWEFSNAYLFGLEGDINYADLSKDTNISLSNVNQVWNTRAEWESALRARFGVNYERLLPYVAGGVAFLGVKTEIREGNLNTGVSSRTNVGFTIGAGVDYALTNNLLLRAEYRYSDYGKKGTFAGITETKLTTNNVRLGIAYKF